MMSHHQLGVIIKWVIINLEVAILVSFEAYKRPMYLFVFLSSNQASKKQKLNKIHSPLKILDYSILVRRLVYNTLDDENMLKLQN